MISVISNDKYSVMQSDGNSFFGDVVLDSFNKEYRDKDSILDQKYEKWIFWDLYYEDFNFWELLRKKHIIRNTALVNKELMNLSFRATVVLVCISELCYQELKSS